jgi:hypothetical protein
MMGTFGGALEARQIDASHGKLTAEVTGEVETEEGVLVIRLIHVAMQKKKTSMLRRTKEICTRFGRNASDERELGRQVPS